MTMIGVAAALASLCLIVYLLVWNRVRKPRAKTGQQLVAERDANLPFRLQGLTYENRRLWNTHEDAIRFACHWLTGEETQTEAVLAAWRSHVKSLTGHVQPPKGMKE